RTARAAMTRLVVILVMVSPGGECAESHWRIYGRKPSFLGRISLIVVRPAAGGGFVAILAFGCLKASGASRATRRPAPGPPRGRRARVDGRAGRPPRGPRPGPRRGGRPRCRASFGRHRPSRRPPARRRAGRPGPGPG